MRRVIPVAVVLAVVVGVIATNATGVGQSTPTTPAVKTPLWVTHIARYPGGISGGVRAVYAAQSQTGSSQANKASRGAPAHPDSNVQMNDDSYPPLPQNETAVAVQPRRPDGRRRGGERLRQRRRRGDAHVRRRPALGDHADHSAVPAAPATSAAAATRRSPTAAGTTRSTCRSCASSARCPSPRSSSTSPSTTAQTWTPGRQAARGGHATSTTPPGTVDDVDLQRQGIHRRRQHPDQPALRAALRDLHEVPHASRAGSATTARSSSPTPTPSRRSTRR